MANEAQEDLDQFLTKVDDIHRLVQNLASSDKDDVSKAMQESDVLIKEISKTGVDRTVINKSPAKSPPQEQLSQDAFLSAMEKDAQERAENRRKNKILADELKAKGNDAFHQQMYEQAVDYYTQGLQLKKDYDILYTNRAQVYVKQGRFADAVTDCDWALKVTPEYIKAFIIKGKCLMNVNEFDRAKEQFLAAEQIAVKKFESTATRRMIEECIQEVERQRERHQREEAAKVFLANENASETISLTNTLRKLRTEKQPVMFYVGGMDLLCQLIKDETTRTAFRVNNGFELFNSHPIIASSTNESLSEATFNLMMVLCDEDEDNIKQCLESKYLSNYLNRKHYSSAALQYLVEASRKAHARSVLLQTIAPDSVVPSLLDLVRSKGLTQVYAAKLLGNLAVESKLKHYFHDKDQLVKLVSILKSSSISAPTHTALLSLLINLCGEKGIRSIALEQTELLSVLMNDFEQDDSEHQSNLLGLLINLTAERSTASEATYPQLCETVLTKMKNSSHHQRICTLLGNIVMHHEQAVATLLRSNIVSWISQTFQKDESEETIRAGVRLLALCTQSNEQAQQAVATDHKLLSVIYAQLTHSQHSLLVGNGALVFGHVSTHPLTRAFLRDQCGLEKTMKQMLKLVEEAFLSKVARKNVAIFITKLVKADESFLQEFRNQHGTEILHSAMKDVDL